MIEQTVSESMLWDDRKAAIGVLVDAAELRWPETPDEASINVNLRLPTIADKS